MSSNRFNDEFGMQQSDDPMVQSDVIEIPDELTDYTCPLCLSTDNVKAHKVMRDPKLGWWSYCYADHSRFADEYPETPPTGKTREDCLWFCWPTEYVSLIESKARPGQYIKMDFDPNSDEYEN